MSPPLIPLGEITTSIMGQAPPSDYCNREGMGTPFVKAGEFGASRPVIREWTTKPLKVAKRSDVLLCVVGATCGKINRGEDCAIGRSVAAIRCNPEHLDNEYLFYFLGTFTERLRQRSQGAAQTVITREMIAELPIPLPPLPEQRRIAAILDKADALRARRREAIAKLDQLLQSVFLDMLGAGEVGRFPLVALDDAYWFQEGPGVRKWQFTEAGVKLLNVGNIEKDGTIDLSKTDRHVSIEEAHGKYRHFLVDAGDLVIASSGVSFDIDGLLRTRGGFITSSHLPLCMNTSTIRFKALKGKSSLRFLQAWINSAGFRKQITRLVTGSAQQNFGPSHLRQLSIPLPPLAEQDRFGCIAERVEERKRSALHHMTQLDHLFSSLQRDAFSGAL